MSTKTTNTGSFKQWAAIVAIGGLVASAAIAAIIDLTLNDFKLPGTKMGVVGPTAVTSSSNCTWCHGDFDPEEDHTASWEGSLMGLGGYDPLFWAQMTTANQDVANAGYYCMKCHVPMTWVTGNALPPDGAAITDLDREGVACHFCHAMADPIFRPGVSPPEDEAILAGLQGGPPGYYANAMFVLDPTGTRRAARTNLEPVHEVIHSPFHKTGSFCGTCHEVGNVAVSRRPDGSYRYNAIDTPTPDTNPAMQFPLERTYTEWRLSTFASAGVDMGGRFGGTRGPVVSTCQDCHMPGIEGPNTFFTNDHPDLAHHTFAGASAQALDLIAAYTANNPNVNQASIARGRARAVDMLTKGVSLELHQSLRTLRVRVINETGHKLPTGHIEGRRVWVNVRLLAADGSLVREYGHYDEAEAHLDEHSTVVYEMLVGLSEDAAQVTGLPPGVTGRMALADTIEKDNRIPPRGFTNAAFEAAGAPVVGWTYADGQHWDEPRFDIPANAVEVEVRVFYQQTPRHYIEMLRDSNTTNSWGQVLYQAWQQTGRGVPIEMATARLTLGATCDADVNCDGVVNVSDLAVMEAAVGGDMSEFCLDDPDFNGDFALNGFDVEAVSMVMIGLPCP